MKPTPELARLRQDIERIDHEIIRLIAERVRLAREVGAAKHEAGLATLDHARDVGLSEEDEVRQIFWQLIGLCRRAQAAGR